MQQKSLKSLRLKNAFNAQGFVKLFLLFICFSLLPNCSTYNNTYYGNDTLKKSHNPYNKPLGYYLEEVEKSTGEEKNRAALNAAGRLIEDGRVKQSKKILKKVKSVEPVINKEKTILAAITSLLDSNPKDALKQINTIKNTEDLSPYYKSQYHLVLARAYKNLGRKPEAIKERIILDSISVDANSKKQNIHELWLLLTSMHTQEIYSLKAQAGSDTELNGWLDLSLIAKNTNDNNLLVSNILKWQKQYPAHEGIKIVNLNNNSMHFKTPKKIAVLLPLTGSLQGPGNAIYDGFMKVFSEDVNREKIDLLVYNTDAQNIESLYDYVVKNGADYVVGPLQKSNVLKIAQMPHPVPTIVLNDLGKSEHPNLYQFGLSPYDEAREVAKRAISKGARKALVIAPKGEWGNEVMQAFNTEWLKNGGKVEDTLLYDNETALTGAIKNFLDVAGSEERGKKIKRLLNKKVETIANRRQDFDMVFLLAYPEKGRQIMPLLNYYYASDVPIYATSSIYSGNTNPLKDRDLNGVIFCDMPWVFNYQMSNKNWPEQYNSYNRLFALGMDSYYLLQQLNKLTVFPVIDMQKNGVAYLNEQKRISRVMAWGKFSQGVPKMIN